MPNFGRTRARLCVDRSLDGPEDARHDRPFIEEHRFRQPSQCGVGIGLKGDRLCLAIEPHPVLHEQASTTLPHGSVPFCRGSRYRFATSWGPAAGARTPSTRT